MPASHGDTRTTVKREQADKEIDREHKRRKVIKEIEVLDMTSE